MKHIRLVDPCSARGVVLVPHARGAYCSSCDAVVHDLRRATRTQALALLEASGGRVCGMTRRGPDGQPAFAPEPRRGLGVLRGAALAVTLAACDGTEPSSATPPEPPPAAHAPAQPGAAPPPTPAEPSTAAPDPAPAPPNTDASAVREHHLQHRHHHAPVEIDDEPLVGGLEGL